MRKNPVLHPIVLAAHNPGPLTGAGNNTYLIAGDDGLAILIDAGVGHAQHLADLDAALGRRRARLESVLVTHAHPDHASGAPALASRYGVICRKCPWPAEDAAYAVDWRAIADGDRLPAADGALTAIRTAGHSPDHLVFWHDASGIVFAGDLVIPGASVIINADHGGDMRAYLASLERTIALGARRLCPAHGPVVDDPERLLRAQLEHRRRREREVLAALGAGLDSVPAIADSIYDRLDPPLAAGARHNVRAHLLKLEADGQAVEDAGGRWRAIGA
jgi:glyoxylase-like metal-dependent hydrolase (beta-lactamase superfamily II)